MHVTSEVKIAEFYMQKLDSKTEDRMEKTVRVNDSGCRTEYGKFYAVTVGGMTAETRRDSSGG